MVIGAVAVRRLCCLLALATCLWLMGCSAPAQKDFDFTLENSTSEQFWPQPPELPRYRYYGTLHGETDFVITAQPGGFSRFIRKLIGLDENTTNPDLIRRPQSGIAAHGRIYVTDIGRKAVFVFDDRNNELQVWQTADQTRPFIAPIGICALNQEILVTDAEIGHLVRLDLEGNPVATLGKGVLSRPTGLACDNERGEIYVADTERNQVVVFNLGGEVLRTLGTAGSGDGEFNAPTHLAYAADRLLVSDTLNARVQLLSREGEMLSAIGKRGLYVGNLVRPKGVGFDSDGHVYVIEGYFDRLLIFKPSGELLLSIGGSGNSQGQFFLPTGLWIDQQDRVFVADMFNSRVAILQYLGQ